MHLGSVLVWELFCSFLVSIQCLTLIFRSQNGLLCPSANGKERNFLVTIDNAAYFITGARVSVNVRHHRRAKFPAQVNITLLCMLQNERCIVSPLLISVLSDSQILICYSL